MESLLALDHIRLGMARDNAGIKEVVSTIAYRMMTKGKTALAESAYADACRPGNPRDTSIEEIAEIYRSLL